MKRLAAGLLARAFGEEQAASILGDLEEDLGRGRSPRWASTAPGTWLLWQAILHQKGGKYKLLSQSPEDLSSN